MIIKQISIFIENRSGRLAEITELLAKHNVNIRALSIADTTNFGILRVIVDNPEEVETILRDNSITASITNVIAVMIPDRPGGLAEALRLLADNHVAVEYMYVFVSHTAKDAFMAMRIEDDQKARTILEEHGYKGYTSI